MNRTLAKILYFASLVIGLLLMALFLTWGMKFWAYVCIGLTFAGMIYASYLLRCPGCGRWASKRSIFAKYCPSCGTLLDD